LIPNNFITSANELPGYRITRNIGIVRGITVRSRSIVGACGAGAGFTSGAARVQLRSSKLSPGF